MRGRGGGKSVPGPWDVIHLATIYIFFKSRGYRAIGAFKRVHGYMGIG
jgi:hypothetical protein